MAGGNGHPTAPQGACPMLTVTAAAGGDGARQLARVSALRLGHDAELPLHQPLQLAGRQIAQHLCEFGVLPELGGGGGAQWHSSVLARRAPQLLGTWGNRRLYLHGDVGADLP